MKDVSASKRRKQYVDHLKSASKTCMIHGAGNDYDECKVLGEFGTKYAADQPTKDRGSDPTPRKRLKKKEHTIINNVVDELHMVESKKVSAAIHKAS